MIVSVALCTYNGERFLAEQLESIARQTRVPDEIVILDDRSEDSTVEVAKAVCHNAGLAGVIEVNERRLGVEKNFSRALGRTHGDVIFFCDQDDVWMPARVEKMLEPFIHDPQVSLVYSNGYITGADLKPSEVTLFDHKAGKKLLAKGNSRDVGGFLKQGRSPGIKASAMAFTAWVKEWAGPLPEGVAHDSWLAFFGYALGTVIALNEPLYSYRRHAQTSGKSSTNLIVGQGLPEVAHRQHVEMVREKARLAQCLYERMQYIAAEVTEKQPWNTRFRGLHGETRLAARTLEARTRVVECPQASIRAYRALMTWLTGGYCAIPGYRQQLKYLYHDVRN